MEKCAEKDALVVLNKHDICSERNAYDELPDAHAFSPQ